MPKAAAVVVKVAVEVVAEEAVLVAAAEAVLVLVLVAAVQEEVALAEAVLAQEERVAKVVEQAVGLAVTMPLLPSMPKRSERSCAALSSMPLTGRRMERGKTSAAR